MRTLVVVLMAACVATDVPVEEPTLDDDGSEPRTTFRECRGRPFERAAIESWRHDYLTPIVTAMGAPNHMARDPMVKSSTSAKLTAKFTYGAISKDLQDEDVRVFVDDCTSWVELGDHTTDSDGQIRVPLTLALGAGAYDVKFQVLGDRSTTTGTLWVLPAGTHIVISDIDGTLTASDSELFHQMLDSSHVPVAYPSAVELTAAHRDRGHVVMYLTGRPDWLAGKTRAWLRDLGFAPGPLRVTDSNTQIAPVEGSVGDFKKAVIASLQRDYVVDFAYGNASTDIYAYLGAGLPADDVWIIGKHAGEQSTNAAPGSWAPRTGEVQVLSAVAQPFDR